MAVTPPASFARVNVGPVGAYASGKAVAATPLGSLAANHNHLRAALGVQIAHTHYGTGFSGGSPWTDIAVYRRPPDTSRRQLRALVYATNGGGSDHTLRIVDGSTTTTATVTAGATGWSTIAWTPDSTGAAEFVLQSDSSDLSVFDVCVRRARMSGSLSDAPPGHGYAWAQSAEVAANHPLPVELFNRFLAAPRQLEIGEPVGIACVTDRPSATRMDISDNSTTAGTEPSFELSSTGPHALLFGGLRYATIWKVWVAGRKSSATGQGIVDVSFGGFSRIFTFTSDAVPSAGGPYTWQSAEIADVPAGFYPVTVTCKGSEVWTVQILSAGA